jgi:hypothetical protein
MIQWAKHSISLLSAKGVYNNWEILRCLAIKGMSQLLVIVTKRWASQCLLEERQFGGKHVSSIAGPFTKGSCWFSACKSGYAIQLDETQHTCNNYSSFCLISLLALWLCSRLYMRVLINNNFCIQMKCIWNGEIGDLPATRLPAEYRGVSLGEVVVVDMVLSCNVRQWRQR